MKTETIFLYISDRFYIIKVDDNRVKILKLKQNDKISIDNYWLTYTLGLYLISMSQII